MIDAACSHLEVELSPDLALARWSVDHDVNWSAFQFASIPARTRSAMAHVYAHVLLAEQLGLRAALRLADAAPEGRLRDVARSQLADEQRHVTFFARVTSSLGSLEAVSLNLLELEAELSITNSYADLVIHSQVMENAANALFNGGMRESLRRLRAGIRLPGRKAVEALLEVVCGLVGKDESAHVAHGMRVLRSHVATLTVRDRHVMEARVQAACSLMQKAVVEADESYRQLGFKDGEIAGRVSVAQRRYWQHLEIDAGTGAG